MNAVSDKLISRFSFRSIPLAALSLLAASAFGCGGLPPMGPEDDDLASVEEAAEAADAVADPSGGGDVAMSSKRDACSVERAELMITDLSVVEDPLRTTHEGPAHDPRSGVWTFARLMEDMAPSPEAAPAFVEALFQSWLTDQTVNGLTVGARPSIQQTVLDAWPRSPDGALDLRRAPLRLLAIVNRMDLRDLDQGNAGQGRFVFGVLGPDGSALPFTVIIEYLLPASTEADVLDWAHVWHKLGRLPVPSEKYNAALQKITRRFARRDAMPGRPNGSALSQLRTNEIALDAPWELREFTLSPATGFLQPATVKLTPDLPFNGTSTLADFINQNESVILQDRHTVPEVFQGAPFLAGSALNPRDELRRLVRWEAAGIHNNEARHHFSLNTCNGCHGDETKTFFLHISPRDAGEPSGLSLFLTGTTVQDPVTGADRVLNDLQRRADDLSALVCPPASGAPSAEGAAPVGDEHVRKGIGRVH
jgi:hypothetical protein